MPIFKRNKTKSKGPSLREAMKTTPADADIAARLEASQRSWLRDEIYDPATRLNQY